MTITNPILLQLAAAAGLVIVMATGATYRLVHGEAERQGLNHLTDYVTERARVEETKFAHIQENLERPRLGAASLRCAGSIELSGAMGRMWFDK